LRRRHPRWAVASLVAGLAIGTLLGLGRMAAGAHFLSDAIWSALIAYGIAHALYYYVLRIPAREDSQPTLYPLIEARPWLKAATVAAAVIVGLGIIGGGLLANPHYADLTTRVRFADFPATPQTIELVVDTVDLELRLVAEPLGEIRSDGTVHGFGLPNNEIHHAWTFEQRPVPTLRYRIAMTGWFTDLDAVAQLRIPVRGLDKIVVRAKRGDITVIDETGGRIAEGKGPALDLWTDDGRVTRP
jgi:hypothetical protein